MNYIRICNVRGVFTNIYQWGKGWSNETAQKWNNYLENYKGCYWRAIKDNTSYGCWTLLTTGGAVYLHPMDFNAVIKSAGACTPKGNNDELEDYFGGQLDELKKICTELAEACGGQFTSMVAQAHKIENDNLRQLL